MATAVSVGGNAAAGLELAGLASAGSASAPRPTRASTLALSRAPAGASTASTGTRQRKASSAPRHRRDRRPAVRDDAIGGPGRVARGIDGPRQPLAHAAGVAVLLALDAGHQRGDALRQAALQQRLERGARLVPIARLDGRDGERDRPLCVVRRQARQVAHAVEPVARAVAGTGVGIGRGEVGMRRQPPGPEQHARRARRVALRGQHAAGDGRGRHQVRRQPMRLARQLEGLVGGRILRRLRLRGEQHGAPAGGHRLVDQVVALRHRQRVERGLPVLGLALQIEQRLDRPGELRVRA